MSFIARIRRRSSSPAAAHGATGADHELRTIEAWVEQETGKSAEEVTTADLLKVPRRRDLHYAPLVSPLGGRLDGHLDHLDPDEAKALLEEGDRFLDETVVDEPEPAH
jgi:hypothetical protein